MSFNMVLHLIEYARKDETISVKYFSQKLIQSAAIVSLRTGCDWSVQRVGDVPEY